MTTVPQIVEVYWITPKFDVFVDPISNLAQMMAFVGDGQVTSTNAVDIATNTAQAGAANQDNWGFDPFSLKQFRKAWRVLKQTKFSLNPGDQRFVSVHFNYNQIFSKEEHLFPNYGRNRDWIKGVTIVPLIVVRAGLVGISTELGLPSSEVSYGEPKVGVTSCQTIKIGLLPTENNLPINRVYKGIIEATTEVQKEIDDQDDVAVPEKN